MDDLAIRIMQLAHKGLTCGQILLKMALADRGAGNPDLVRAAAGLAYGCGTGRGTCGALTAACCVLSLHAGKEGDEQADSGRLEPLLEELSDWFGARVGAGQPADLTCGAIVGEGGTAAARPRCGALVAETYAKLTEILARIESREDF